MLRIAALLTSDPHIAEDVHQETLQRLAARWSRVDNPAGHGRGPSTTRVLEQTDTSTPATVNGHSSSSGRDLYLSTTRSRTVPPNPYR